MIAVLAWGSLIWRPRGYQIRGEWREDGPAVSVEFARQSRDGSLTLVLVPGEALAIAHWADAAAHDVSTACGQLATRENTSRNHIGQWVAPDPPPPTIPGLADWAATRDCAAVIWTALGAKFGGTVRVPTEQEALEYLRTLPGAMSVLAEEYVRRTPQQTRTRFRPAIETALGWKYDPNLEADIVE